MIYLAPLQGFTDYIYRKTHAQVFQNVDTYFIPYISVKNNQVEKKHIREVLPENNLQSKVVPQVLVKNSAEMLFLSALLKDYQYPEINLNLGCPYPMVTNRGKGSGLLPYPEKIKTILSDFFEKNDLKLSVKLRVGFRSEKEIDQIIPVLNSFPLSEVILHPRIAKQLYKGEIFDSEFEFATKNLKQQLVYNGDIFSVTDFQKREKQFPGTRSWMLGRGILMNPFLPSKIKGINISESEKREKLVEFHQAIYEAYSKTMDNHGNTLNKMVQFWNYFSCNFQNQKKVFKKIKKSKNISAYQLSVKSIFWEL